MKDLLGCGVWTATTNIFLLSGGIGFYLSVIIKKASSATEVRNWDGRFLLLSFDLLTESLQKFIFY